MVSALDPAALSHPYTPAAVLAFVVGLLAIGFVARLDSAPQTRSYLLYATLHTVGTGAVLGELVVAAPALKRLFDLTAYVFSTCLGSVALLYFAMVYCDRTDLLSSRSVRAVLAGTPLVLFISVFVDQSFHVIAGPPRLVASGPIEVYDAPTRLGGYLLGGYVVILSAYSMWLLIDYYRGQSGTLLRQGRILVAGFVPALVLMFAGIFGFHPYPHVPVGTWGFSAGVPFVLWGLFGYEVFGTVPVAHRRVVEGLDDGVAVTDPDGVLLDVNDRLSDLLGVDPDEVVGNRATAVFEDTSLAHAPPVAGRPDEDVRVELDGATRRFRVSQSPLTDGRDNRVGTATVYTDVTERRQRERELERQNKRLDQFADNLAHDLRNPLAAAHMYANELERNHDDPDATQVVTSLDRMDRMIENVLTQAREGATVTDPEPVDVDAIARDSWKRLDTKQAQLDVRGDRTVDGDPSRLRRLFENAYRNAVEHAGADATVRVEITDEGFTIADDGPGIPESERARVFDSGYTTRAENTGFGLSIIDALARAHDWRAAVGESADGGVAVRILTDPQATLSEDEVAAD